LAARFRARAAKARSLSALRHSLHIIVWKAERLTVLDLRVLWCPANLRVSSLGEPADGEQGDVVFGFAVEDLVEEVVEELVEVGGAGGRGGGEAGEAVVDGLGAALDDAVGVEEEGRAGGEEGGGLAVEGVGGDAEGEGPAAVEVSGASPGVRRSG